MSDERESIGGAGPGEAGGGRPDDEITLETTGETTLETTVETTAENTLQAKDQAAGWAYRLEKIAAARKERRRRVAIRMWQTALPVVVIVIIAMVLLSVFGGLGGGDAAPSTTTTSVSPPTPGSGLLLIEEDDAISVAMLLQPGDKAGVVLSIPGVALLESDGVFKTVGDVYQSERIGGVGERLSIALATPIGPIVTVAWPDLRAAMTAAGVGGVPEGELTSSQEAARLAAEALRTFVATAVSDQGAGLWDGLKLGGDKKGFVGAVVIDARSMAATAWEAMAVSGTVYQGEGFAYLEADFAEARKLLGALAGVTKVSVEVKDGAGVTGAAERAGNLLETAGYALVPMGYAEGFPAIEQTQIAVAPGMLGQAEAVRELLGVGTVVEDATLEAGHVVVTLGSDFREVGGTGGTQ
jgi:hypothetical protein